MALHRLLLGMLILTTLPWLGYADEEDDAALLKQLLATRAQAGALFAGAHDLLEQADRFDLLYLHPEEQEPKAGVELFHGYRVLQAIPVSAKERFRKALICRAVYRSLADPGAPAFCFNPRHGIRARKGKRSLDVVICFECSQVFCVLDGKRRKALIGPAGRPFLNQLRALAPLVKGTTAKLLDDRARALLEAAPQLDLQLLPRHGATMTDPSPPQDRRLLRGADRAAVLAALYTQLAGAKALAGLDFGGDDEDEPMADPRFKLVAQLGAEAVELQLDCAPKRISVMLGQTTFALSGDAARALRAVLTRRFLRPTPAQVRFALAPLISKHEHLRSTWEDDGDDPLRDLRELEGAAAVELRRGAAAKVSGKTVELVGLGERLDLIRPLLESIKPIADDDEAGYEASERWGELLDSGKLPAWVRVQARVTDNKRRAWVACLVPSLKAVWVGRYHTERSDSPIATDDLKAFAELADGQWYKLGGLEEGARSARCWSDCCQ